MKISNGLFVLFYTQCNLSGDIDHHHETDKSCHVLRLLQLNLTPSPKLCAFSCVHCWSFIDFFPVHKKLTQFSSTMRSIDHTFESGLFCTYFKQHFKSSSVQSVYIYPNRWVVFSLKQNIFLSFYFGEPFAQFCWLHNTRGFCGNNVYTCIHIYRRFHQTYISRCERNASVTNCGCHTLDWPSKNINKQKNEKEKALKFWEKVAPCFATNEARSCHVG